MKKRLRKKKHKRKKGSVLEIENYFFILGIGNQGKIGEFMNSWTDLFSCRAHDLVVSPAL
jgi:hypothetical protein